MTDIYKFISKSNITVAEAMMMINKNSSGLLFLLDDENHLAGSVTDGDIRRFLLAGGSISDSIFLAANKQPKVARSIDEAKRVYQRKAYSFIPIIDSTNNVIDIYCGDEYSNFDNREYVGIPVVINAGGKGTRLDPFTRVLPKPLIPIGDIPIIERIMRGYQLYGCDSFNIIVNYKKELIKAFFADCENSYNIEFFDESKPLGTGGGLSLLRGKLDETFIFTNCDVMLTADYSKIYKFHKDNQNDITMICAHKTVNIPYGVVETFENGIIANMKEKPVLSFLTNTGIYIVEANVIDDINDNVFISFPDIIKMEKTKGKRIAVYQVDEDEWMDMGQLPELKKMQIKFEDQ